MIPLPRLLAAALIPTLAACATVPRESTIPVEVGIIALNDFHGALEPPRQAVIVPDGGGAEIQVPAGGAAWLASAVDGIRAKVPHNLTVAAGDLISGSPLISSLHLDEPAIGVLNRIGLDFSAVGNHEFDRGREEILRMQNGGCARHTKRQPCAVEPFTGAKFRYLAASTLTESGEPLLPSTALRSFGDGRRKVTVGLIGLTLKGTAQIVTPEGIAGLTFADEAETINAAVPRLKAQGADAVVVLIHQGGLQEPDGGPNGCSGFTGDIRPILDRLDDRVDLVVSGHTHRAYVCDYATLNPAKPFLLTSAGDRGRLVTDIRLMIDPATNRVVAKSATNLIVQSEPFRGASGVIATSDRFPGFAPRQDVSAYVAKYAAATREFSARPVGAISAPAVDRVVVGQLIADAQLAATQTAGAQMAFMNRGGVRAALLPRDDGQLTFGDIYAVQPFGNELVTGSLTGAQIREFIEQSLDGEGSVNPVIPSAGLSFTFDARRPAGSRIVDLRFQDRPLDPAATYRVTVSNFLAGGGDGYTVLKQLRDQTPGGVDVDALEAWIGSSPPRAVPTELRAVDLAPPSPIAPAG
ncbi:MAG: bifunctional metallophosphatase/5'-nucleotidase [Novosphingobium sp.]|nr:bifunctional metallophosphatase/5'-nucleotidase [Novosphingobium sp.]